MPTKETEAMKTPIKTQLGPLPIGDVLVAVLSGVPVETLKPKTVEATHA